MGRLCHEAPAGLKAPQNATKEKRFCKKGDRLIEKKNAKICKKHERFSFAHTDAKMTEKEQQPFALLIGVIFT